ncbi:tRNA lysidine(34) synthetase TilS [Glaciihabitans arcticus]|uniref:tRNA(Ile)-lysidine synthase n=1 Tax=Glaciihabitans arcticus TaxID=2668039 RepID=A0A4Q9GUT3_9MICO|nr:tRNA lysidine(34) synthetase TilS [Glaciihabitans arcticus]TBN57974.1 tRNA lysidine(34) synthetase TilS [Glaciihabitans arcticus]
MDPDRRPRLTPAIADVRRAVRAALPADGLILVALSGGPDSLALAAATAFEAPRAGVKAGAVIVDHGLQQGSADVAAAAAQQARLLGLAPVLVRTVTVGTGGGPESAARDARYAALAAVADELDAAAVLLGHTLDDQAETVLLGLARGSGATSLQGMPAEAGLYHRPLLGIRRSMTEQFCVDSELEVWNDPQNDDEAFTRVRVRHAVLPVLEAELGPGIAEALARTAGQLREDADALDHFAEEMAEDFAEIVEAGIALPVKALAAQPPALRQRLIRFVVASEFHLSLSRAQTLEISRLVTDWHGQKSLDVPGVKVERRGGRIVFHATGVGELTGHDPILEH